MDCDYSVTPPVCDWVKDNYNPTGGGYCQYRRLECQEQVKTVVYIDDQCVPHVSQYCRVRCFNAELLCGPGGWTSLNNCPLPPPAGCTTKYTPWSSMSGSGWSSCTRP